jgi:hypothetical protein
MYLGQRGEAHQAAPTCQANAFVSGPLPEGHSKSILRFIFAPRACAKRDSQPAERTPMNAIRHDLFANRIAQIAYLAEDDELSSLLWAIAALPPESRQLIEMMVRQLEQRVPGAGLQSGV